MKLDGVVCHTNGLRTQRRGLTEEELNSPCVNPADVCQQWGLCSSFVRWAQASARPGCPQPASVPSRASPCQGPAEQPGRRNPNPSFERFHVARSEWFLMCPEQGMLSSWQGWGNNMCLCRGPPEIGFSYQSPLQARAGNGSDTKSPGAVIDEVWQQSLNSHFTWVTCGISYGTLLPESNGQLA